MTSAAFFDLDKTVIAKSSTLAFSGHFYRSGMLGRRTLLRAAVGQLMYLLFGADQEALEAGLAANPDELAAYSAYADYLMEHGDPRGEFVRTQLALEDTTRPKADRDTLKKREAALLKKHAAEWMGDLGKYLLGKWSGEDKPYHFRF